MGAWRSLKAIRVSTAAGRQGRCVMIGCRDRPVSAVGRIAQLVRAPALHAGSRGFESLFAHEENLTNRELECT